MTSKKKELTKAYKETHPPMGIYQIRNLMNDKLFIGSSLNLPGILNRSRLELIDGRHLNKQLQADWNELGGERFTFEVLDELTATEGPEYNYRPDLASLEDLWLEKLQPYGERGYNEKKKSREARLQEIIRKRLDHQ
jgi:hypothetical protein